MPEPPARRTLRVAVASALAIAACLAWVDPPSAGTDSPAGDRPRVRGAAPTSQPASICGTLERIGDARLLHVWGTAYERGYAHGYLLANEIHDTFEAYLADLERSGGPDRYRTLSRPLAESTLRARPIYEREMRGIADGMNARLGEKAVLRGLDRPMEYGDIFALNAISDWMRPFCSSFVVWGGQTVDGSTLTGRNLDWPRIEWMIGADVIIVQSPGDRPRRAGWVSLAWPGFIGCMTGMNEHGVTISIHDVPGPTPERPFGFVPRGLALREAIEQAEGRDAIEDVARVVRRRVVAVATNVMVSRPYAGALDDVPAAVIEYDGVLSDADGVTVRRPEPGLTNLQCTNHYRQRRPAERCSRYETISAALRRRVKLNVDLAWEIVASAAAPQPTLPRMLSYHSVVFEPNARRIHVAFATKTAKAADRPRRMLDVRKLLAAPKRNSPLE
ncbi:MAG: C45 family autoproteolytic acyltransferase/hydrolase [Phycisphaerae bacterium]|nr:C45 family autoproteolytic acyltransferase/hydrolase [Phycisphaerae bacterium]